MDINIGALASTALNFVLSSLGAEVADKAVKAAGAKVFVWLKSKLTESEDRKVLENLEAKPNSLGAQTKLKGALLTHLENDDSFAEELKNLLDTAGVKTITTQTMTQTGNNNVGTQISGSGNTVKIGRN